MSTINISLPHPMKMYVEQQIATGQYGTVSEYIRTLVREDQKRQAREQLEEELLAGLNSGRSTPMTKKNWRKLKQDLIARHGGKKV